MERILRQRWCPALEAGLARVPLGVMQHLEHVDFLLGVDPVFAGLSHESVWKFDDPTGDRSSRSWPHITYGRHACDGMTTVVIPDPDLRDPAITNDLPAVLVHELGHALHECTGFISNAIVDPTTAGAHEDFAMLFTAWLMPDSERWGKPVWQERLHRNERLIAFFEALVGGDYGVRA